MQEDEGHIEKEPDKSSQALPTSRKRNDTIHMKILVPSGAVGAIIGKGGESIAQVQWETGARIKLSKPNDFYPGTVERVCLIQGTLEGVTRMHNYIMDRMLEKPECMGSTAAPGMVPGHSGLAVRPPGVSVTGEPVQQTGSPSVTTSSSTPVVSGLTGASCVWPQSSTVPGSRLPWGRHQQVKILVPNCTAGLVIGKVGTYVKEIKDRTGAFIQISQKSKEINLLERCITIAGEPDQCRAAVALVLAKIAEDPQSTSCPTISYSRVQGPVASAYPTGSPFAFATLPRYPSGPPTASATGVGPGSAHLVRGDGVMSGPGYLPLVDPYTSPVLHAALLQATALAASFNQRTTGPGYYPVTCMTTSPPPPAPPPSQGTGVGPAPPPPMGASASSGSTAGQPQTATGQNVPGFGSHEPSPHGAELGLYAAMPNAMAAAAAAHLLSGGGLWAASGPVSGGEATWTTGETQIPGLAAAQAGYDSSYPAQMNFAFYPTNQSAMLASLASRHPSEPAGYTGSGHPTAGPEFYPTSPPYAAAPVQFAPPGSTLRVTTSPGTTPQQLASVYPAALASTTTPSTFVQMGSDRLPSGLGGAGGQTPAAQAIQLGDLFASLRLGAGAATAPAAPYADFSPTEFGQAFAATLSQHGLVNVPGLATYPLLASSTPISSGAIAVGTGESTRPPVSLSGGRLVGTPTGLGVTIGPARDTQLFGVSRPRPPPDTDSSTHYTSGPSQQSTLTVKRRSTVAVATGSDTGTNVRHTASTEQSETSTKGLPRTTEVKRPASCYLSSTNEPVASTSSSAVRSSPDSDDSQTEEADHRSSDPSGSGQSNQVVQVTSTSISPSRRSSTPPVVTSSGPTVRPSSGRGSTVGHTSTTSGNTGSRRVAKQVLNGGPVTTSRTPNGVRK